MSLFNETVKRVSELEAELASAHERIRNLEIALKAARVDKMRALGGRGENTASFHAVAANSEANRLSEKEVDELFRQFDEEALMANAPPDRSRLWAPVQKMCRLLQKLR